MSHDFASILRRIESLEANRGTVLRFGKVTESQGGFVRVEIPDNDRVNSYRLPTIQKRVLKDKDITMPDIGEPVAILCHGQGFEDGVVLGACYSPHTPDPEQESHVDYKKYEDGTELWYDRKSHKLVAKVQGDVELTTQKNLKANIQENAEITVKGKVNIESAVNITLKAPTITLAGALLATDENGDVGTAIIKGSLVVREGGVAAPDNDVTAGEVSLLKHEHEGVMPGDGMSSKNVCG